MPFLGEMVTIACLKAAETTIRVGAGPQASALGWYARPDGWRKVVPGVGRVGTCRMPSTGDFTTITSSQLHYHSAGKPYGAAETERRG